MCVDVKSRYYQQYVKNLQLRTSAFYPLHLQISSAKIIRILSVSTTAHPQIRMSAFYRWPSANVPIVRSMQLWCD